MCLIEQAFRASECKWIAYNTDDNERSEYGFEIISQGDTSTVFKVDAVVTPSDAGTNRSGESFVTKYDAIYYKKDAISCKRVRVTADVEQYFRNEITKIPTSEVWKMENKKRRIGNDPGLSLMEQLDKQLERIPIIEKQLERMPIIEKQLAEQAKQLEQVPRLEKQLAEQEELAETRNRPHWQVRVAELERLITTPNAETHFNRNAIVHGADVFNDYEALKNTDWSDNLAQFNAASQGFFKAYGFQWDSLSYDKLRKAPKQLIDMLNMRGNVTFLGWFSGHKRKGGQIQWKCDEARRKWEESIKVNGVPYPEDAVRTDYKKVQKPYNSVRNHEMRR
ncbi:hypothetical protein PMAA_078720 [Talaromyces marneffei ATCC 18224]|uniref:Uncharacterized protein n=1 Tax=Talaromyces marneffei (strain ATCC 18224 / CBS 334.59 / QM 7333) TaxID=441960 RepID=B6QDX4_TALMQ|nr:hypothetical protein PMAA_078720 [Talaromyces marneffei ATCC 18224]